MSNNDRVYYKLKTHLEMLRDSVRCLAYQKALESVVRDKVVLDVGCGSGILSFFAVRAGARQVFAVDMDIPPGIEEVARINGVEDRIEFIKGRIQDVRLPVDSVDVVVSEWMGGLLLMEDMLPAVIYARDRWLKPGGILLPDLARLFLVPLNDVAGISSEHHPTLREISSSQIWVSVIDPSLFLARPTCILDLDLSTVQETDVRTYQSQFRFKLKESGTLNGFGLWFDVLFSETRPPVMLSTAPWGLRTHWAQGLWVLPVDIDVLEKDEVSGTFNQTALVPSSASFESDVHVNRNGSEVITLHRSPKASPSGMNPSGSDEGEIINRSRSGAYNGCECFWIGCSMSMGVLMAAGSGAKEVMVLNHSDWASDAMQRLAAERGLTHIRFLKEFPSTEQLHHRDIKLLGQADGSWQALIGHIKARRILGETDFILRFRKRESPWNSFYGFDFSPFAKFDLEMTHQQESLTHGIRFDDITDTARNNIPGNEELIYAGAAGGSQGQFNLFGGHYNCIEIGFKCGAVTLPLPETVKHNAPASEGESRIQTVQLIITISDSETCRFNLTLTGSESILEQDYYQPITSMGHIVSK